MLDELRRVRSAPHYPPYGSDVNSILPGYFPGALAFTAEPVDVSNLRITKSLRSDTTSRYGMSNVVRSAAPFEINCSVVVLIKVLVVDSLQAQRVFDESPGDQPMNPSARHLPTKVYANLEIAAPVLTWAQYAARSIPDPALIRDFISAVKRHPSFLGVTHEPAP